MMILETITLEPNLSSMPQTQVMVRSVARRRLDRELNALDYSTKRRQHTVLGFVMSVIVLALLLWLLNFLDITPYSRQPERVTIPIQLLQFGTGNPTLPSAGNLTAEGAVRKAAQNPTPLEDARKTVAKVEATAKPREYTQPSLVKPVKDDAKASENTKLALNASSKTDVGSSTAPTQADGEGLGRFGSGAGRGQGYSLDWGGGGGNRVVLHKELPKYPAGITTSTQIKMRFTVQPNGSVGLILPMQKGEPALERAAMEALRRWQFNPLNDGKEMIGFITFTFRIQ